MWPPQDCSAVLTDFAREGVLLVEWLFRSGKKVWIRVYVCVDLLE